MPIELLRNSDFFGSFESWTLGRRPFLNFIRPSDRVLDIGCANGFLLISLLIWHEGPLIPYGFDIRADRINEAKRLIPEFKDNIWRQDYLDREWRRIEVDVAIAPWVTNLPQTQYNYVANCIACAKRNVLFHLYDDRLELLESMQAALRSWNIELSSVHSVPGKITIAVVDGYSTR